MNVTLTKSMELLLNGQINRFSQIFRKALFPSGVVCSNLSKVYSVVLRNKRINWTRPFIFQRYLYLLNTIRQMQFSYIVASILRQWRKMKGTSLRGKLNYGFTYFLSGISFKFVIRYKTTVESRCYALGDSHLYRMKIGH